MEALYSPAATAADIEILLNVSRRSAERVMAKFKSETGYPKYKRPSLQEIKKYLGKL